MMREEKQQICDNIFEYITKEIINKNINNNITKEKIEEIINKIKTTLDE